MDLYPAIDIRSGRVVRLSQGESTRQTVYGEDPAAVAERFADEGARWIHVVDLDRALGQGDNDAAIMALLRRVDGRARVQLGGGFRTLDRLRHGMELGVARAIIGTAAAIDPAFVPEALKVAPAERLAVGVDARGGMVAIRGWTETSTTSAQELTRRVAREGIEIVIYTDVTRDGMLAGPDLKGALALQRCGARVVASGGVTTSADIRAACEAGLAGVIVGRALYEQRLTVSPGPRRGAMRAALVILLAAALAAFTYFRLEGIGSRGWVPMACRAIAWAALGLLILNVSCPAPGTIQPPFVLLDGSLSLTAPGGRWQPARTSALKLGEVRLFGDERSGRDTLPDRGRSLLGPSLTAAAASDRPIIVMTDGEVEDAADLAPELLGRASVRVFPRDTQPDRAVTAVTGPSRVTAGDSIVLEAEVQLVGGAAREDMRLEVLSGAKRVGSQAVRMDGNGGRARVALSSSEIGPGDHVLRIRLTGSDAEPRTDTRLHLVTVAPTPGVVLLASPGDWDSRFLYRALRDVAQLPVRGFVRLETDRWRSMTDLRPVPAERVRQAARQADLLIVKGEAGSLARGTTARGIWRWPTGGKGQGFIPGDWYLSASDVSPVAGAFLGQPVDSFPPASGLAPVVPNPGDWVALTAQLGRRGAARPAAFGRDEGRVRTVTVVVDGLWRWAFRGGSSEQSYRGWVAATASWLLAGADSARGAARTVRPVVTNGRPVMFEWSGIGPSRPLPVTWTGAEGQRADTLRFDGSGRALVWMSPGEYRYRLEGGGGGTVAVEEYSDELLPRPVTLTTREARVRQPPGRTAAREWLWLFAVAVLAFAGEWLARRRLGLR